MENDQEMEGEQGWRRRHPDTAGRKRQCMKGLVPQQVAKQEACGFVFFKGIETKTKRTKNPLENKIRRTQYEKHNTKGR